MLIDNLLVLSSAQAVTATAASTSFIDQGAIADVVTNGLYVEFLIRTGYASNSATIAFELECDDNTSFSSPKTLFRTGALADTVLIAGFRPARVRIPLGAERYIQARYTVTGTGQTGTIDCRLVKDVDVNLP